MFKGDNLDDDCCSVMNSRCFHTKLLLFTSDRTERDISFKKHDVEFHEPMKWQNQLCWGKWRRNDLGNNEQVRKSRFCQTLFN